MGSLLGNWPSRDPHNFSQLRPSDPAHPSVFRKFPRVSNLAPTTYHPTHERTLPPEDQVISTEPANILLRQFYHKAEEKLRPKRVASDYLVPDHRCKQPRGSFTDGPE